MPTPNYTYVGDTDLLYILTKIKNVLDGTGGYTPGYVQKETGKGLSTNDFTSALLTKLNGITEGADSVEWTQTQASGTKIAEITINGGTPIEIFVPTSQTITIDSTMSSSSENAVQNKVIKQYVDEAVGSVVSIEFRTVNELPVTGENGVIYLVPNGTATGQNRKDEYVWITSESRFEKIGTTDIDLSGYVQSSDLAEITTSDIDSMFNTVFGS